LINTSIQLKPYPLSSYEQYLWHEAEEMIDERLHGNYRKGAVFECFIYLIFDYVVDVLGLKNKVRVLHNPFSYRKYISREGRGIDILVQYKRWTGNWIQLFAIECKNWLNRFMSPKVFKTHVQQRFFNVCKPLKILITKGVNFSVNTLTKIRNYQYKQITNNYVTNIRKLITDKLTINNKSNNNMSKSVPLHKTRKYEFYTRPLRNTQSFTVVNYDNKPLGDCQKCL